MYRKTGSDLFHANAFVKINQPSTSTTRILDEYLLHSNSKVSWYRIA